MAVLIEAENVVIRNATAERILPGGLPAYEKQCPNRTFCTDGQISRVGFMTRADAVAYIDHLAALGFSRPTAAGSPEVALVGEVGGLAFPCDWLQLGQMSLGSNGKMKFAWLRGADVTSVVAPPGWKPAQTTPLSAERLAELEYLGTKDHLDVYRDRKTGQLSYVARTQQGAPPAHVARESLDQRLASLADELIRLGAVENAPAADYRGDLTACYERAKQLVEDTQGADARALHVQGILARMLERWEEAASLFRRVTELRPELVDGWLELTWALSSLEQYEEAETAALRAVELDSNHAGALGNLALLLAERGRLEEARPVAERALATNPGDEKNKAIFAMIEERLQRLQEDDRGGNV